ncbi:MAG: dephospho-CoA kinase [Syntrophorhabdales bacterium]|jgi:dephospho-CoA kinase
MILICLTGILGSGKSTVTALLRRRGFEVIDLDALARDSLNWKETQNDIKDAFGKEYIVHDRVDVERLKGTAFTKENLRALEAIIHPRIRQEVRRRLAALEEKGTPIVFVDHPLLFEVGFHSRFDSIVLVTADMDTIRERLKKRGMDARDIETRLSFQIPLKVKEKMADYVIDNSGTEDRLEEQVDALLEKITNREVS